MDRKEIEMLIRLVEDSDIQELHISNLLTSVKIVKAGAPAPTAQALSAAGSPHSVAVPTPVPSAGGVPSEGNAEEPERDADLVPLVSPMVGTFYAASSPESPAFLKQGDHVSKGQVVCIVEAMKLMNEIESEVQGTIVRIVARNATPVEFGETLFLVQSD